MNKFKHLMNITELHKFAKQYNGQLFANDERFNHWVHIIHHDGSTFLYNGAFILYIAGTNNFIVFTEHFGYHIFDSSDVVRKQQFDKNEGRYAYAGGEAITISGLKCVCGCSPAWHSHGTGACYSCVEFGPDYHGTIEDSLCKTYRPKESK